MLISLTSEKNELNDTLNMLEQTDYILLKAQDSFNMLKARFNRLKQIFRTTQGFK